MKVTFLLTLCAMLFLSSYAQEDEPEIEVDTLEQDFNLEISIGKRNFDSTQNLTTHWLSLGLGVNTVLNDGKLNLPNQPQFLDNWNLRLANSTNVLLGIVSQQLNLVDHKFFLSYGLEMDMNKYSFKNDFFIDPDTNIWQTTQITEETKKNRLATKYLQVPVMLSIKGDGREGTPLCIAAGGFSGIRIGSNQKVKFKGDVDTKKKVKTKDDFNLTNFQYGLRTELGYGIAKLYSTYKLNKVFNDGASPHDLNGASIGLMIIPF